MKYAKCLALVSLFFLIVTPMLCLSGCVEPTLFERKIIRDDETEGYLRTMEVWHEKWDELYWRKEPSNDTALVKLIDELVSIDPPRSMELEHKDYVIAHQLYLAANRNLCNLAQIEPKYFDEYWYWRDRGYEHMSHEYHQARQVKELAFSILSRIRAEYEIWYFWRLEEK